MESLFKLLEGNGKSEYYPYHMPGHKRRLNGELPIEVMETDITEIDDFDNLHNATGILQEAQKRASHLYGSRETFFLINGSTCGILSAISAAVPEGGRLLMARHCHKAAYHGVYLRHICVDYLYPNLIEGTTIADAITPAQVKQAMEENTYDAVLIVSPTYEGRISNIEEIAKVVHEKGSILIVDEAHGAHLGFSSEFSKGSVSLGADLVIHSVHKTLPSLTQTALLHLNDHRVDEEKIRRFLRIYQSSSPSYLLMAGIDNCLRLVEEQGDRLFETFASRYFQMMEELSSCEKLRFLQPSLGLQDIGKLVILTGETDITGKELYDILRTTYQLQLEMAGGEYAIAMFTVSDTEEGFARMTKALLELDTSLKHHEKKPALHCAAYSDLQSKQVLSLSKAWDQKKKPIRLSEAKGLVAGDFVNLYPPGIPILVPGEQITEEKRSCIQDYIMAGYEVQGIKKAEEDYFIICIE